MKQKKRHSWIIFLMTTVIVSSCSVRKYIPENEVLLKHSKVKIKAKSENTGEVKEEIEGLIRPQPNTSLFGWRLGLLMHFKAQKEKPGFIVKYLNKQIGEEPAYLSQLDLKKTERLVLNRLENRGYYSSRIDLNKEDALGKITCSITLDSPYRLHSYQVSTDSLRIYEDIASALPASKIQQGSQFSLAQLKEERERLDAVLKSKGYYNFNADFLLFEADTNGLEGKQFDLFIRLKRDLPREAIIPYQIDNINVYPNYSINGKVTQFDTSSVGQINFLQKETYFLPERLEPFILFEPQQYFNPDISRRTSSRLSSIGSYKFVNIQFEESEASPTDTVGKLNAFIYLSPQKKRALRFELQAVTKSNSFTGPSFAMTHTNRNLFKGGEIINLSASVGYEQQFFNENNNGLRSTQFGLRADLLFPRLLSPIPLNSKFIYTIPKTKISAGIEMLNRSDLYQLTSFNSSFGYLWKSSQYIYHEINPVSVNYVRLSNTTDEFDEILDDNLFLKNSFEQELIAGLTYNFTYTQLNDSKKNNRWFLSSNFDVAGNSLSVLENGTNENGKQTVLGIEYAQYAKLDADIRYHIKIRRQQSLISRIFAGYGLAYGNSTTLPFSKQYFAGGPYSVRSFRIRSLGPGTYTSDDNSSFFDQSGDIRLEANVEYRFPFFSYLKGALFADAGNVWLRKENEALPGGKFSSNFINEIGMGAGLGIRFDIQSFVIRFDLATPIQKPTDKNRSKLKPEFNESVLNFALGYPF